MGKSNANKKPAETKAAKNNAPVIPAGAKPGDEAPPEVKGAPVELADVSNETDRVLNQVAEGVINSEHDRQRKADAQADYEDSSAGAEARKKATTEGNREAKKDALLAEKGPVLTGGFARQKIAKRTQELVEDPKGKKDDDGNVLMVPKAYKNYPIRTIEGKDVQFVASNPIHNKANTWDEGYTDGYFHFLECEHPMYDNSVCTEVVHENHDKVKKLGFVIKTDQEIQLFLVK